VFDESNSVSLLVRDAAVADARDIAQVHVDAWRAAYTGLLPDRILAGLSVTGRETQWRARLSPAARGARTLVAEDTSGVCGFVTFLVPSRDVDEAPDVGEIPALYVGPDSWRAGAGGALIAAAEGRMREEGCSEAILWMLAGNTARAFYESRGWVDDGGRRPSQYFPAEARLEEVRFRKPL
jgi:GNAT superfamily N-acetyltransferase